MEVDDQRLEFLAALDGSAGHVRIPELAPGSGAGRDKEKAQLPEIIANRNERFSGQLSDTDKVTPVRC